MSRINHVNRSAAVALFASAAFFNAPVFGQETAPVALPPSPPAEAAPVPVVRLVPPSPVQAAPAPAQTPRAAPAPVSAAPAERVATERPRARVPQRAAPATARTTPAAAPVPASAPAATAPTPAPAPEAAIPAPVPEAAPPPVQSTDTGQTTSEGGSGTIVLWLIAACLAGLAVLGLLAWRRRRAVEAAYYEQDHYEEPVDEHREIVGVEADDYQPAIVAPSLSAAPAADAGKSSDEIALTAADGADVAALAASSAPDTERPWLEFLMRPVRAGTTADEAVVEFELTVGNTGSLPAEDVRISTWMLSRAVSEMEQSLIEPPAEAATSETRIEPGDGTRVEATVAVPRAQLAGDVLPVVVADARYRLPDGGEGRTAARFAVGLPSGKGLAPFAVALGEGLRDDIEARLEGEPDRV